MHSNGELKILLVEDSALTAKQLLELIKTLPHDSRVSTVATERSAVEAIETSIPDIVVLDLLLKQGSGFGFLRKLALITPKPAVIVVTNFALPKYREYALLIGADYFLDKAQNFDLLPSIIDTLVAKRGGLTSD